MLSITISALKHLVKLKNDPRQGKLPSRTNRIDLLGHIEVEITLLIILASAISNIMCRSASWRGPDAVAIANARTHNGVLIVCRGTTKTLQTIQEKCFPVLDSAIFN